MKDVFKSTYTTFISLTVQVRKIIEEFQKINPQLNKNLVRTGSPIFELSEEVERTPEHRKKCNILRIFLSFNNNVNCSK